MGRIGKGKDTSPQPGDEDIRFPGNSLDELPVYTIQALDEFLSKIEDDGVPVSLKEERLRDVIVGAYEEQGEARELYKKIIASIFCRPNTWQKIPKGSRIELVRYVGGDPDAPQAISHEEFFSIVFNMSNSGIELSDEERNELEWAFNKRFNGFADQIEEKLCSDDVSDSDKRKLLDKIDKLAKIPFLTEEQKVRLLQLCSVATLDEFSFRVAVEVADNILYANDVESEGVYDSHLLKKWIEESKKKPFARGDIAGMLVLLKKLDVYDQFDVYRFFSDLDEESLRRMFIHTLEIYLCGGSDTSQYELGKILKKLVILNKKEDLDFNFGHETVDTLLSRVSDLKSHHSIDFEVLFSAFEFLEPYVDRAGRTRMLEFLSVYPEKSKWRIYDTFSRKCSLETIDFDRLIPPLDVFNELDPSQQDEILQRVLFIQKLKNLTISDRVRMLKITILLRNNVDYNDRRKLAYNLLPPDLDCTENPQSCNGELGSLLDLIDNVVENDDEKGNFEYLGDVVDRVLYLKGLNSNVYKKALILRLKLGDVPWRIQIGKLSIDLNDNDVREVLEEIRSILRDSNKTNTERLNAIKTVFILDNNNIRDLELRGEIIDIIKSIIEKDKLGDFEENPVEVAKEIINQSDASEEDKLAILALLFLERDKLTAKEKIDLIYLFFLFSRKRYIYMQSLTKKLIYSLEVSQQEFLEMEDELTESLKRMLYSVNSEESLKQFDAWLRFVLKLEYPFVFFRNRSSVFRLRKMIGDVVESSMSFNLLRHEDKSNVEKLLDVVKRILTDDTLALDKKKVALSLLRKIIANNKDPELALQVLDFIEGIKKFDGLEEDIMKLLDRLVSARQDQIIEAVVNFMIELRQYFFSKENIERSLNLINTCYEHLSVETILRVVEELKEIEYSELDNSILIFKGVLSVIEGFARSPAISKAVESNKVRFYQSWVEILSIMAKNVIPTDTEGMYHLFFRTLEFLESLQSAEMEPKSEILETILSVVEVLMDTKFSGYYKIDYVLDKFFLPIIEESVKSPATFNAEESSKVYLYELWVRILNIKADITSTNRGRLFLKKIRKFLNSFRSTGMDPNDKLLEEMKALRTKVIGKYSRYSGKRLYDNVFNGLSQYK